MKTTRSSYMPPEIRVRKLRPWDVDDVKEMNERTGKNIEALVDDIQEHMLVAEKENEVVGFIWLKKTHGNNAKGIKILVKKGAGKKDVAAHMLQQAEKYCKSRGMKLV